MSTNGRTLVFSFDGTGNEPSDAEKFEHDESISNVLKLHILMGGGLKEDLTETATANGEPQHTYYYNGIGTRENGEDIPLVGWLVSKASGLVNSALAPKWGDARRILKEAKADLSDENPTPRDRIIIFGFSRGAALARKFASILLKEQETLKVAFLGVFDTVAAMNGIHRRGETTSSDVVFENGTVHESVQRAVHILSLDEDRIAFEPTQMNRDADSERITEIWFPGVHSDIGGGYWHDGLGDVALKYMIDKCRHCLKNDVSIADPHDPEAIRELLAAQGEILSFLEVDDVLMHPNVMGVAHVHTEGLGKLYSKETRDVCIRENDLALPTNDHPPLVHHSVKARFDLVPDYRPGALRGLNFRLLTPTGQTKQIHGVAGLRVHRDGRKRNVKLEG